VFSTPLREREYSTLLSRHLNSSRAKHRLCRRSRTVATALLPTGILVPSRSALAALRSPSPGRIVTILSRLVLSPRSTMPRKVSCFYCPESLFSHIFFERFADNIFEAGARLDALSLENSPTPSDVCHTSHNDHGMLTSSLLAVEPRNIDDE
jgi:hypothetical protein